MPGGFVSPLLETFLLPVGAFPLVVAEVRVWLRSRLARWGCSVGRHLIELLPQLDLSGFSISAAEQLACGFLSNATTTGEQMTLFGD